MVRISLAVLGAAALLSLAAAQPPAGKPADEPKDKAKDYSNAPLVVRMMAFDKRKDGKLTRDEITDPRLLRLFDEADADKDGVVTKEELIALAAKLDAEIGPVGDRFGLPGPGGPPPGRGDNPPPRGDREPPGPPPGPGGPDGPPGPPPGPGGFGPPRSGQILPDFLQGALNLTDAQKKQLDDLQKDVDAKLDKILTDDQKKQLKEMRPPRGPGRDGPPGDRRGSGDRPPPPPGPDRDRPNPDR